MRVLSIGPRGKGTGVRRLGVAVLSVAVVTLLSVARPMPTGAATVASGGWTILEHPINRDEQLKIPWGTRSDWLQPWRAYLNTVPASTLRNALGINFNCPVQDATLAATILGHAGFKQARIEVPWSAMSYSHPGQLADPSYWETYFDAFKAAGMSPLIMLNANSVEPVPETHSSVDVAVSASAGATTIQLTPASVAQIVPGLSGFDGAGDTAAQYLFTSVSPSGLAQLSQPLPADLPAGVYPITTLRYQPFAAPFTASGRPNALYRQTLAGWLLYVKGVTSFVKQVFGNDHFDVEVWNEMVFGADFLRPRDYYVPVPASMQGKGNVTYQLAAATAAWIHNPANGLPDVKVGDGFASMNPLLGGSNVPPGINGLDRHPYYNGVSAMPGYAGSVAREANINALGKRVATRWVGHMPKWTFLPTYTAFFPEFFLNGIATNYLERDLSPFTTSFAGVRHGRDVRPAHTKITPQMWVTEMGFRPTQEDPGITLAQYFRVQAKAALRTLASFVDQGATLLDFYSVDDGSFSMIDPALRAGGPTMQALNRFMAAFAGPARIGRRRSLALDAIATRHPGIVFAGNGTAGYPNLTNLDVTAFFPFQTSSSSFVVAVYVMTRNLEQPYGRNSRAVGYFDLPARTYRFTIGGLHAARLHVSATDPLTGRSVPVAIVARSGSTAVVQMQLTDSVRLLKLTD